MNTDKIPLWLVWVYDSEVGASLRAIDTKYEFAKGHKQMLESEALSWGKDRRVRITIEAREANHLFGAGVLSRILKG